MEQATEGDVIEEGMHPESWRFLLTGSVFILLFLLTSCHPPMWLTFFCLPAAFSASLVMGVPMVSAEQGFALLSQQHPMMVTLACSGGTFFGLLTALMLGFSARSPRPGDLMRFLWVVPLAYVITISANTSRIVLAWLAGRFARAYLHESLWGGVHYGVGVFVFLLFLILGHFTINWRSAHVWDE